MVFAGPVTGGAVTPARSAMATGSRSDGAEMRPRCQTIATPPTSRRGAKVTSAQSGRSSKARTGVCRRRMQAISVCSAVGAGRFINNHGAICAPTDLDKYLLHVKQTNQEDTCCNQNCIDLSAAIGEEQHPRTSGIWENARCRCCYRREHRKGNPDGSLWAPGHKHHNAWVKSSPENLDGCQNCLRPRKGQPLVNFPGFGAVYAVYLVPQAQAQARD